MKQHLLFLCLVLSFACSSQQTAEPSKTATATQRDTIRIAMRGAPDSFNPYMTTTWYGETIAARLFPTLMSEGPAEQGRPTLIPYLAKSFASEGLETTITLNQNMLWSDGTPITANDVFYSFELQTNAEVAWLNSDRKANIESMTIDSDHQLTVRFKSPSPFNDLDLNEGFIVPAHYFKKFPIAEWKRDWSADLVCYGPYEIDTWDEGQRLVLKPRQADLPRIGIAITRDQDTLFNLLQTDKIDAALDLPTKQLDQLKSPLKSYVYDEFGIAFLGWNLVDPKAYTPQDLRNPQKMAELRKSHPHPLFGNVRVREAMAHAVNRDGLLQKFWHGTSRISSSPWQALPAYFKSTVTPREYNIETAKILLKEAGWHPNEEGLLYKDGEPFTFSVIAVGNNELRSNYLLSIQQDLKAVGITMAIDLQEGGRYGMNCQTRNFDAMYGSFNLGTSPDLKGLYHSASPMNFFNWDGVDDLLMAVPAADTMTELSSSLQALDQTFYEEQPMLILHQRKMIVGAREDIFPQANHVDPLHHIQNWATAP